MKFVEGSNRMQATVSSYTDPSQSRLVKLMINDGIPLCCSYSNDGSGYPCLHGIAMLLHKYGPNELYKFIEIRHHTSSWKEQYAGYTFNIPDQCDVNQVLILAKTLVAKGDNVNVPKALPPPRGRPVHNAGKRKKSWYENGPAPKKNRTYSCSI